MCYAVGFDPRVIDRDEAAEEIMNCLGVVELLLKILEHLKVLS